MIHTTNTTDTNLITETRVTVYDLLDEDTLEYVSRMFSENSFDDNIREAVCGILMEVMSSRDDIVFDEVGICNGLFAVFDINKQQ